MDKTTATLLGALTGVAGAGSTQAATRPVSHETLAISSYADLLKPIPNASAALKAVNEARQRSVHIQKVQFYFEYRSPYYGTPYYPYPYGYTPYYGYHPYYNRPFWHHHHHWGW